MPFSVATVIIVFGLLASSLSCVATGSASSFFGGFGALALLQSSIPDAFIFGVTSFATGLSSDLAFEAVRGALADEGPAAGIALPLPSLDDLESYNMKVRSLKRQFSRESQLVP